MGVKAEKTNPKSEIPIIYVQSVDLFFIPPNEAHRESPTSAAALL
jgi:hypothetical protein